MDETITLKGLIMTEVNPKGSVLDEQFGTENDVPERINDATDDSLEGVEVTDTIAPADAEGSVEEEKDLALNEVQMDDDGGGMKPSEEDPQELKEPENFDEVELPPVDYSGFSRTELVETLELLVENRPITEIKPDVDRIKALFYTKQRAESEEKKTKFLEDGGKVEEYVWVDPLEVRVKDILEKYREKKFESGKVQEAEKNENLKKKNEIIDKIKELVNREEAINKTFQEFRALQSEWYAIGPVPQSSLKELWDTYNHNVELFYDYIKINKELRDLDLKKNLEAKIGLCEKAEELLLETNPVNAFRRLQEYHNLWREVGPVPLESKNEVWERFKEATAQVNKRHHDYFDGLKEAQQKNLEAKNVLCEEIEKINQIEYKNFKEIDDMAEKVIALQQVWRTIGFAPKKQNNKVYQRFRKACDAFFEKKRSFFNETKEEQNVNLQRKLDLCAQAEALQDSTDWKATSDAFIQLQKEWKTIGVVSRKHSEKCWKRFRKACDTFFDKKAEHFNNIDSTYEENLNAKLAIIEELEQFVSGSDINDAFERLKEIQRRWMEIGFVPFAKKEEITKRYRDLINREYDKLKITDEDKNILKYRNKLDALKTNPKVTRKIQNERDKFYTKIKQLESDIVLWENNIGFFTKSANAETMIREVQNKIENAKKTIKTLEEKVKMIDQSGLDE